jgi:hypothetical protein
VTRPGAFAWFGASVVWLGAATLSFSGLDGLAESCYISPALSPLMPLVIDVGVAVAAWVWRRGANEDAARLAGRMTWSLLVLTITGNGAHLGMEASHVTPPWWVAAVVGAIPPAVAGATAHLLVLLGRAEAPGVGVEPTSRQSRGLLDAGAPTSSSPRTSATPAQTTPAPPARAGNPSPAPSKTEPVTVAADTDRTVAETKARALLASNPGMGRRALMAGSGLSEYEARKLLESFRTPRNGVKVLEEAK